MISAILKKYVRPTGSLNPNIHRMLTDEEKNYLQTCEGDSLAEKLFLLTHPITRCPCGKKARFANYFKGYGTYCSPQCSNRDENKKQKTINSFRLKFGVDNPQQNKEIKEKTNQTKVKKYGAGGVNVVKSRQTKLFKYGDPGFVNPEKGKETKLFRYQDPNYNNREKAKITCQERYGCATGYHKIRYVYDFKVFDSSWELAYYIFLQDHKISFQYKPEPLIYFDANNVKRFYYPDFRIKKRYVEIKANYLLDERGTLKNHPLDTGKIVGVKLKAKRLCLRENRVIILNKEKLGNIFRYVKKTYGYDYLQKFREKKEELCLKSKRLGE